MTIQHWDIVVDNNASVTGCWARGAPCLEGKTMAFTDLRQYIEKVEELGELREARNAHWDLEIGGITELAQHRINGPAVLFDDIPDYPSGYRVLSNSMGSASRTGLVLGLPTGLSFKELLPLWRERSKKIEPIPMRYVNDGPIME